MIVPYDDRYQQTAKAYADFYEALSPETVRDILPLISSRIHFIDPFNDVVGAENVVRVLEKMFDDVKDPRFVILDVMWSNKLCFLRWDFTCHQAMLGDWSVRGMSELHFDEDAKVCAHYDYWDSGRGFYRKLPVIGSLVRFIMSRASI
ncbi:MAG: nuclear transport factor 2 family protein [Cohaesibacter sp.]|nr:nuclear transport factor 2 family protein [Cohaesibacter sp.]